MQQVQLTDRIYKQVKRRADKAGFKSVDEYVTDVLISDLNEDTENVDHFFTPERLAHIGKAAAQIKAGEFYTAAEVRVHFKKRFAE